MKTKVKDYKELQLRHHKDGHDLMGDPLEKEMRTEDTYYLMRGVLTQASCPASTKGVEGLPYSLHELGLTDPSGAEKVQRLWLFMDP